MLNMESKKDKKNRYSQAIIEDGVAKVYDNTPPEENRGTQAFREVGIWVTGKEKEADKEMFKWGKTLASSNVRNIGRAKRSKDSKATLSNYFTGLETYIQLYLISQLDRKINVNEEGGYEIENWSQFTREVSQYTDTKLNRKRVKQAVLKSEQDIYVSVTRDF